MARKKSEITPEIVAEHGLSESEYEIILDRLGREPNLNELGIFAKMRASLILMTAMRSSSKWNRITTPLISSPIKARRRV